LLILFLLDTGCRVGEVLSIRVREIDFDNLLLTLDGKGRKQRVVPFSFELRRAMFRYISDFHRRPDSLLLATRNETKLGRRVMLRAVKHLCDRLGIEPARSHAPLFQAHIRRELSQARWVCVHLQKVLGHSTLEMTRRYANLVTADLQAVHERISLLRAV
jgi:integrase/recombinase XerD